jgi:hypothetical protein
MFMTSEENGCDTQIFCATNEKLKDETGCYYDNSKKKDPAKLSKDNEKTDELYLKSKELVAKYIVLAPTVSK